MLKERGDSVEERDGAQNRQQITSVTAIVFFLLYQIRLIRTIS